MLLVVGSDILVETPLLNEKAKLQPENERLKAELAELHQKIAKAKKEDMLQSIYLINQKNQKKANKKKGKIKTKASKRKKKAERERRSIKKKKNDGDEDNRWHGPQYKLYI